MTGGSHNRDSHASLSNVLSSRGKRKLCKCPLHRNGGKGTLIPQTEFKRHGITNVQGMCAAGKTLIDSYSHMLKRLQLLVTINPNITNSIFQDFDSKFDPLVHEIKNIVDSAVNEKIAPKLTFKEKKLTLLTRLDKKLKTRETGFYDSPLSPREKYEFYEKLKDIFTEKRIKYMEREQAKWTSGGYVLDSKDHKLYPVEQFIFNVSKKREFYDADRNITPYRINVHNTRSTGHRSSTLRGERYLADGSYTEANRKMKLLGNGNRRIHADHIIPLALGGIHDPKNLRPLSSRANIYKKDKLTKEGYHLLLKDLTYLSKRYWPVFNKYRKAGLIVLQEALRDSINAHTSKIIKMNHQRKTKYLKSVYPTYKDSQIERIIKKHFTNNA